MKFYQKTSPNYIVALISKVLENHHEAHHNEANVKERFYSVCTYCRVKYGATSMEL